MGLGFDLKMLDARGVLDLVTFVGHVRLREDSKGRLKSP